MADEIKKTKKVLLVYPKMGAAIVRRPPLSVIYLASYLERDGYPVEIIDMDFDSSWRKKILDLGQDLICVGISALTGYQILSGLEVTDFIKANFPALPVIWGGVHPTLNSYQTLENKNIDIIIRGEGEITITEVVAALSNNQPLDNILGISFKRDNQIIENQDRPFLNMDTMPAYSWHLVNFNNYHSSSLSSNNIALQTSRGCPGRCSFCYNMKFNAGRWRAMSPEKVYEIVKELKEQYKIDGIVFWNDNFFVDFNRVKKICQIFIDRNLDIKWEADCRIDYLLRMDDEFLQLLKTAGLSALFLGAESGSPKVLKAINKGITVEQILQSAELLKKYDFRGGWYSFMLGFPEETAQDASETIKIMKKLKEITPAANTSIKIFTPYPGSPLFDLSKKFGFVSPANLNDWGKYSVEEVNTPWPKHKFSPYFSLCTRFAVEYDRLSGFLKNPIVRVIGYLIHKVEKFRWEHEFWFFPIELMILKKIRKIW